ncbi:MAG: DUF2207 domain-containing protein [Arachnia propionica]|uniref:DUF2207 family protein n=1 Tax=Arachnia propionica TaxID=1750 RepID=UPI002703BA27|nr:DUF2207 domain-containing protein [Arachnia propionica]
MSPWLALAAGAAAVVAALALARHRWWISRDDPAGAVALEDLAPAMVGLATRGRVMPRDILAFLVDLAVRGHLVIHVTGEGKGRDWVLHRGSARPNGLTPTEHSFLDRAFARHQKVSFRELAAERRGAVNKLATRLLAVAEQDGWFHPVTRPRRIGWWPFVLAGSAAVAVLVAGLGWLPALLFLAAGTITLYQPQLRARRTARGSAAREQVLARREALTGGAGLHTTEDVSRELPWVIALGLTTRLPELTRGIDLTQATAQFDWVRGRGGALEVGEVVAGGLADVAVEVGGRALVGVVVGAVAFLLDG